MRPLFKEPRQRRKSDFYPTPREATTALLNSGALRGFGRHIWEPACGEGAISKPLAEAGYVVESTDLEPYGFGLSGIDFLDCTETRAPAIITNPPFLLAAEFILHARKLGVKSLALLLKVDYFSADRRFDIFYDCRPADILNLTWRLDFTGDGAPPMNCAWFVWRPGEHQAQVSLLRRHQ